MQLTLQLDIPPIKEKINYQHKILLIGSCFTEHISERLAQHKFDVLQNPNGILFNPISVAQSLNSYMEQKKYTAADLFRYNELWNSWQHHTRFSDISQEAALQKINSSQNQASCFIREADYVIITLGSAFYYKTKDSGIAVANNHRVPSQWLEKSMMGVQEITEMLALSINAIKEVNPKAKVIFTISPVRHIRDGVVANNRSKARLIQAVHQLCDDSGHAYYFPAYELVIDILRDYRYYDIDFVHPNYPATQFVWEQFVKACVSPDAFPLMEAVKEIVIAANHKTRFPQTEAHQKFMNDYAKKVAALINTYPFLNLEKEQAYFNG